ncbi:hypothetical protein KY290_025412 [Solanum tuberosum]|uniref:Uncharacterized protein n=1 Tax=Solanum tuberosum TaxID=4113 RepID=A0ABQ7UTI1_SOLTU|nr:hypothetical protein KY290_025412 [Solanum tuberosum]
MAEDENVEIMFSRFSKIICELQSLGMVYNKDDKKKTVAFTAETSEIGEKADENQDEGIALINRGVRQMLIQRRQRPQQEFKSNNFKRNNDRCYYYGKPGHIKKNCPERRINNRRNEDPKSLGAWDQGKTTDDDHDEMTNLCFMALGETSEVRPFNCPNCNDLQSSLDMVADELQKVIDEYNKIAQEKKDWQVLLEASQIEVDLLMEELEELKMQLNNIRKSPSHSSEQSKKTYRKGMWVLDSGCSRHMCGKKENFKTIKRIDGGYVRFGDNAKEEVIGVGIITLSSSCDLVEVYLVEGLKHNLLSISQLCDAGFQVTFNTTSCIIRHPEKKLTLIGDRVNNIYVLNNVDFTSLTCLTAVSSDPWLCHRKLGHASMHALEKLSRLELVIGLPKLKFEKDHVCDACQLGKQTHLSFKGKDIVSTSKPFQLLHMDLFGPTRTASIRGKWYAFVIVDDFSRSPQQNGVVERKNRSLQDTARTMLLDRNLPDHFWAEVVSIACHILNRCLIRPILKKTPYELWRGKKPNISYLHPFGCKYFIHNNGKNNLDIPNITLVPNTDESAAMEMESTTPADKTNIPREWRHNASYPENFILGKPDDKIQTKSSLRKQASVALISQMEPKQINEAIEDESWEGIDYDETFAPVASSNPSLCENFANLMKGEFEMSLMGELTFFLGLQIKQSTNGTFINQTKYTKELIKKFGLEKGKAFGTPMSPSTCFETDAPGKEVDEKMYREMVGSLLYLTASRPDIMFSVCKCARFQAAPKESHLTAVKRIIRYLIGTTELGLWCPHYSRFDLIGYSDADFAVFKAKSPCDKKKGSEEIQTKLFWNSFTHGHTSFFGNGAKNQVNSFLKAQKLSLFFSLYGLELFEEVVHLFYANLRVSSVSGELETLVLGTRIIVNDLLFEDVFGTKFFGVIPYMNDSWPDDFEVTLEGAKTAVVETGANLSDFGPLSLCFEHCILAYSIATTLLPRKGSLSNISNRDVFVLYCLLKKYRINWVAWFKEYMWESVEESNPSVSLPYELLIPRMVVDRLVDLSMFKPIEINATYDSRTFYNMGYVEVGDRWVKKDSVQERADTPKPTKISAHSAALLLQDSNELKTRIIAIKRGLETLYDAVEKVFRLQKDTSTNISKLRIAMTIIKQESISIVNKLIRQVNSLKTGVNSSNNELAISVQNSYSSLSMTVERSTTLSVKRLSTPRNTFGGENGPHLTKENIKPGGAIDRGIFSLSGKSPYLFINLLIKSVVIIKKGEIVSPLKSK